MYHIIPIAYVWVYKKLLNKESDVLRTSVVIEVIKRNFYRLPRTIHYEILKEMEGYNLISQINRKRGYRILKTNKSELKRLNWSF